MILMDLHKRLLVSELSIGDRTLLGVVSMVVTGAETHTRVTYVNGSSFQTLYYSDPSSTVSIL